MTELSPILEESFSHYAAEVATVVVEGRFIPFYLKPNDLLLQSQSVFSSLAAARKSPFRPWVVEEELPDFVLTCEEGELRFYDVRGEAAELTFSRDAKGRPSLPDVEAPGTLSRPSSLSDQNGLALG